MNANSLRQQLDLISLLRYGYDIGYKMNLHIGDLLRGPIAYQGDYLLKVIDSQNGYSISYGQASTVEIVGRNMGPLPVGYKCNVTHDGTLRGATNQDLIAFGWAPKDEKINSSYKGETKMKFGTWLNDYVEKHRDVLFTIAVVLVLDHYVFEGKFRQKIEDMVEGFLKKNTAGA